MKKLLSLLLALFLFAGCSRTPVPTEATTAPTEEKPKPQVTTEAPQVDFSKLFSDRDYRARYETSSAITLNGNTAATNAKGVKLEGNTLTITAEGAYVLSGPFAGMVLVDGDKNDKIQLVLQNVDIDNPNGAAIYIRQADKVFLTLEGKNTLTAGETFVQIDDSNIDGAVFSKDDLTINGQGSLEIQSPGGHGIVCKDSLHMTGSYHMQIASASHGITANDEICIDGGSLELKTGKDGLHCENSEDDTLGYVYIHDSRMQITCEGDGISASSWLYAQGGEYEILAGGGSKNGSKKSSDNWGGFGGFGGGGKRPGKPGSSQQPWGNTQEATDSTSIKGIKADTWLTVDGGKLIIDSADDGLHSNGGMDILGGSMDVSSGDDGIHAEQTLTITGGSILIKESYEGLEALHVKIYDGDITLTASDDGINAAGGTDESGFGGRDQWGGGKGGFGGFGGGNGSICIAGGTVDITASGDALDANGTLEITGGKTTLCGPTRGDTAVLDYDRTGIITGGEFLGTGSTMMAQTLTGTNQGVLHLKVNNMPGGTPITITDSKGNVLCSHTPALDYAMVIFSSTQVKKGEIYTLTMGSVTQPVSAK